MKMASQSSLIIFLFALTSLFPLILGASLGKCGRNAPNLNDCLKGVLQEILKNSKQPNEELNIPILEKMEFGDYGLTGTSNAVQVEQHYSNVTMMGYSDFQITKLDFNTNTNQMRIEGILPKLEKRGQYNIKGNLLMLPVQGEGPVSIILYNSKWIIDFQLDEYEKDGRKFYQVTKCQTKVEPENVHYRFDNLFGGDKLLGDNINYVLNENPLDIFNEMKPQYQLLQAKKFKEIANSVLSKHGIDKLFSNV